MQVAHQVSLLSSNAMSLQIDSSRAMHKPYAGMRCCRRT